MGVSRYPQIIIHQGYIEQTILDFLEQDGCLHVERCTEPRDISIDYSRINEQDSYPITILLEHHESSEISETINSNLPSTCHTTGQKPNANMDGSVSLYETLEQDEMKGIDVENLENRSASDVMTIKTGCTNAEIKQETSLQTETDGAIDSTADMSAGSTTNRVSKPRSTHEIIKAKYLLGCDGAHSWTRKQLNIPFEGNQTQNVWGVIDIIPLTDFRKRHANIMTDIS